MSILTAVFNGRDGLAWVPWDGTALRFGKGAFAWIDAVDAGGEEIAALQRVFGLHELAVEDSMGSAQVAKVDLYADHVFIVAKAAELGPAEVKYTDVGIFLTDGRAISVCRSETAFGHSLRESVGRAARRHLAGPEFVAHQVLDLIVDGYFPVVQMMADEILRIEKKLLHASLGRVEVGRIFQLRREAIHFRHTVTRMSEACNKLATLHVPCISEEARPYFRDVLDNLMRIDGMTSGLIDVIRAALEASSLLEQQRQSAITRQLAAWAAILGVPTAIAGIYGMNFINMPETQTRWDYFAALALMGCICAFLYWRFRRLGWLQPSRTRNGVP
jgi:magnesium transporter